MSQSLITVTQILIAGASTVTVISTSTAQRTGITSSPLTTTFAPDASCTNDFYTNTKSTYYSIGGPSASTCFPSGWDSTSQYFSPGICPEGYTEACSVLNGYETRATCCPNGYSCYTPTQFNFVGQACASIFTSQETTTVTDGEALTALLATLHATSEAVNGYGVSIRYKPQDFMPSTSSSMTTSGSGTGSSLHTSSVTPSPTSSGTRSSTNSSSSSSSLSTGAKAGVGVGVAAVALIALFALGFWILKKRKARAGTDYQVALTGTESWRTHAKPVHEIYSPPSELGGSSPSELGGSSPRPIASELESPNLRL